MVNAWSLAGSILSGTFDEDYPIVKKKEAKGSESYESYWGEKSEVNTSPVEHSDYYYDYKRNDPDAENPFTDPKDRKRADEVVADIDDMYSHHFGNNTVPPYITKTFKYEENAILKQAEEYIAKTYELHYTGDKGTQTLDLIESIGDAEAFCRSNAIKYLSRFGKKDGKNEKDILKAIHYCTLLHHFAFINDNSN